CSARLQALSQGDATITFHYDRSNRLISIIDSAYRTILVTEEPGGRITKLVLVRDGGQSNRALLSYDYDDAGNLIRGTDFYNNAFSFGYDNENRMISRT